ncbi:sigma-54 interaction domain-containing protein [Lacimicrobium alkaliphilum]|nr:sigma-54-dependent Fis family transcriptional regulator [Lacimicrobium alkaliphilum]
MNLPVIQSMIDAVEKPAIFITPDYRIQAVNQAYKDTYSQQIYTGSSHCYEISHGASEPCDRHGEDCPLLSCAQSGRTARVVHVHQTPQGKQHCDILMRPIRDEDGMTLGYLEILDRILYASAEVAEHKMVGRTECFNKLLNRINRAASSDISVLLQGETGTGKELVARSIHDASERHSKPFIIIECAGLNDALFESELFGHHKGAFTGATHNKKGLVEEADGGTLFLDEIGDVPLHSQVKLLRLLETGTFRSVGGLQPKRSDFRLICATHKDLLQLVEAGEFRQDLYYRIAGLTLRLPPLRQRRDDIPLLIEQFLGTGYKGHKTFSAQAMQCITAHDFPGNIRELKNLVEQSVLMANDDVIWPEDLPVALQERGEVQGTAITSLQEHEQQYLTRLCQTYQGTPEELARQLGVSARTLYRKLQKYGLKLNKS